jgi:hypothetical protein
MLDIATGNILASIHEWPKDLGPLGLPQFGCKQPLQY